MNLKRFQTPVYRNAVRNMHIGWLRVMSCWMLPRRTCASIVSIYLGPIEPQPSTTQLGFNQ